jgi:AcrR family transcriptional regulator
MAPATIVAIVDELGPDSLTMRAVAARLGAGAMSLYRHVSGREELLDLVLAAMVADVAGTPATGEWR